jgi:hypothetical protein
LQGFAHAGATFITMADTPQDVGCTGWRSMQEHAQLRRASIINGVEILHASDKPERVEEGEPNAGGYVALIGRRLVIGSLELACVEEAVRRATEGNRRIPRCLREIASRVPSQARSFVLSGYGADGIGMRVGLFDRDVRLGARSLALWNVPKEETWEYPFALCTDHHVQDMDALEEGLKVFEKIPQKPAGLPLGAVSRVGDTITLQLLLANIRREMAGEGVCIISSYVYQQILMDIGCVNLPEETGDQDR